MLEATKTNICMFMHAVFEKAEQNGIAIPLDKVPAITEAAIDAALHEEAMCAREGVEPCENPEAMYQEGQDYARDNL